MSKAFLEGLSPTENGWYWFSFSFTIFFCIFYFTAFYLKAHLPQILSWSLSEGVEVMVRGIHISVDTMWCYGVHSTFLLNALWIMPIVLVLWILNWRSQHTCFRTRLRTCHVLAMDCVYAERTQLTFSGGHPSTYLSSYGGAFSWLPLVVLGRCPLLSSTWKEQFESYFYSYMSIYLHSPKIKLKSSLRHLFSIKVDYSQQASSQLLEG